MYNSLCNHIINFQWKPQVQPLIQPSIQKPTRTIITSPNSPSVNHPIPNPTYHYTTSDLLILKQFILSTPSIFLLPLSPSLTHLLIRYLSPILLSLLRSPPTPSPCSTCLSPSLPLIKWRLCSLSFHSSCYPSLTSLSFTHCLFLRTSFICQLCLHLLSSPSPLCALCHLPNFDLIQLKNKGNPWVHIHCVFYYDKCKFKDDKLDTVLGLGDENKGIWRKWGRMTGVVMWEWGKGEWGKCGSNGKRRWDNWFKTEWRWGECRRAEVEVGEEMEKYLGRGGRWGKQEFKEFLKERMVFGGMMKEGEDKVDVGKSEFLRRIFWEKEVEWSRFYEELVKMEMLRKLRRGEEEERKEEGWSGLPSLNKYAQELNDFLNKK